MEYLCNILKVCNTCMLCIKQCGNSRQKCWIPLCNKLRCRYRMKWEHSSYIQISDLELYTACLAFRSKIYDKISYEDCVIYFKYLWKHFQFPIQTFLVAIELLETIQKNSNILQARYLYLKVSENHWKQPLLIAIIIARKTVDDDYILNSDYLKIFQKIERYITINHINNYELQFLILINWKTNISNTTYLLNFEKYESEIWIRHIVYDIVKHSLRFVI